MILPNSVHIESGDCVEAVAHKGSYWLRVTDSAGRSFLIWLYSRDVLQAMEAGLRALDHEMTADAERVKALPANALPSSDERELIITE